MYRHMFLLLSVLSHPRKEQSYSQKTGYCILVLQFSFFQMIFRILGCIPRVIFDCLYFIPCFRGIFLTSVWLIASTRLISLETNPASSFLMTMWKMVIHNLFLNFWLLSPQSYSPYRQIF